MSTVHSVIGLKAAIICLPRGNTSWRICCHINALGDASQVRFELQGVHDVGSVHNGFVVSATAGFSMKLSEQWNVGVSAGVNYASKKYADTYFSVTNAGALASGLSAYTAKAGLKDAHVGLSVGYNFSKSWSAMGSLSVGRLLGNFARSPIIKTGGTPNMVAVGVGVGYSF